MCVLDSGQLDAKITQLWTFYVLFYSAQLKLIKDKDKRYQMEIIQLEKLFKEHPEDLDSATYVEILEEYKGCKSDFEINDFLLYPEHLSVMEKCGLRHAINSFGLSFSFDYNYQTFKEYFIHKIGN